MFAARFQVDAPVDVSIRGKDGDLEIPSGEAVLHIGISVCNLRLLARAASDALNEHDIRDRNVNVVPIKDRRKRG